MLEIGPKAILAGLVKRIDQTITIHSVVGAESLDSLVAEVLAP